MQRWRGAPVCCCVLVCGLCSGVLGSGWWTQKAPALMTVWSAARGAGRLSKRGHSFCLRSLAGPIQPPTPLQHPLSAHFPLGERGGGGLHAFPLVFCHQRPNLLADLQMTDKVYLQVLRRQIYCLSTPETHIFRNVRSHKVQKKSVSWSGDYLSIMKRTEIPKSTKTSIRVFHLKFHRLMPKQTRAGTVQKFHLNLIVKSVKWLTG